MFAVMALPPPKEPFSISSMAWSIFQSVTVEAMTVGWESPMMSMGCEMSKWVSAPAASRALREPLSTAEASPHMTSTL